MFYFETLRRSRKTLCRPKNRRKRLSQTRTQCGNDCGKVRATFHRRYISSDLRRSETLYSIANKLVYFRRTHRNVTYNETNKERDNEILLDRLHLPGAVIRDGNILGEDAFVCDSLSMHASGVTLLRSRSFRETRATLNTHTSPQERIKDVDFALLLHGCCIIPGFVTKRDVLTTVKLGAS